MTVVRPRILRAEGDLLFDDEGRSYVDLFSGHGAAWLGHADAEIAASIADQLGKVWIAPGFDLPLLDEARSLVGSFFPASHALAALYSTGMEAAEFAIRLARVATGRPGLLGFENSMHGKSLATAHLGWDNGDDLRLPDFTRLPFVGSESEEQILHRLEECLAEERVAAVFVEPIQGCGAGRSASDAFFRDVARCCREHGTLLVFDELLTGFHRTGPAFYSLGIGIEPDVVLIGKALGNGFPVSGVVSHERLVVRPEMLPGSTFAGNPLAVAGVVATLRRLQALDVPARVAVIERIIRARLAPLVRAGLSVRGRGALFVVSVPGKTDVLDIVVRVHAQGVCVGHSGREIRVLPAATIEPTHLEKGCSVLAAEVLRAVEAERALSGGG